MQRDFIPKTESSVLPETSCLDSILAELISGSRSNPSNPLDSVEATLGKLTLQKG